MQTFSGRTWLVNECHEENTYRESAELLAKLHQPEKALSPHAFALPLALLRHE